MRANIEMKALLEQVQIFHILHDYELNDVPGSILHSGLVELRGCWFLKALLPGDFDIDSALEETPDEIVLETAINQLHLKELFTNSQFGHFYPLLQGFKFVFSLKEMLDPSFLVIFSCDLDSIIDCTVRFYKERAGHAEYLDSDLEQYKNEAVLVLEGKDNFASLSREMQTSN